MIGLTAKADLKNRIGLSLGVFQLVPSTRELLYRMSFVYPKENNYVRGPRLVQTMSHYTKHSLF